MDRGGGGEMVEGFGGVRKPLPVGAARNRLRVGGGQVGNRPHWFSIGLVLVANASAQAVNWKIDPLHSSAQFSVRHMMISTVRGQFGGVKGEVVYDAAHPEKSSVDATIDCT